MEQLIQQVAAGLANGAIYACLALALVMIFVSTDHINFAQGEMAMFSAFMCWQLLQWGMSFWIALPLVALLSLLIGVAIERTILRPLHSAPVLSIVVVFIGLIMLVGIVVKNAIVLIDRVNQLREHGVAKRDAIVQGAESRLRPIVMTVVATILGAVPLVIATGAGAESRAAIGIVIVGGLGIASLLTLFVTPVVYTYLDGIEAWLKRPAAGAATLSPHA